ncbi:lysozyme-like [Wyeomyia smithii]|uniref:lysozyme-like n=1 Tax=Wyeomyia smithii TaxID=174621 RepID=UPI002468077B|nr:lysozyme-like [Wyeomyia smithii]
MYSKVIVCLAGVLLLLIAVVTADVSHLVNTQYEETPVTEVCLRCICDASSGCDPSVRCTGDACGMFRITWAYWADAGKPVLQGDAPESQGAYANCANDALCAARTVQGYMRKFGQDCNGDGIIDCLDHAAIHKLGGYGCKSAVPVAYQSKIDQCIHYAAGIQV